MRDVGVGEGASDICLWNDGPLTPYFPSLWLHGGRCSIAGPRISLIFDLHLTLLERGCNSVPSVSVLHTLLRILPGLPFHLE